MAVWTGGTRARPATGGALPLGTRFELEITGLAAEGDGVGRYGSLAVFVPQGAPGDLLRVAVTDSAANYVRARILSVVRPGPDRVAPPCPVYAECGGCTWQHLSYAAQLQWKRRIVVEALRRVGHLEEPEGLVHPTLPAEPPWRYRHKMAVPFAPADAPGAGVRAGFYAARSHRVVPFESCRIQHPLLDRVLAVTRHLVDELGIPPYDERTRTGVLRHLVARVSRHRGEVLVALVTPGPGFPAGPALAAGIRKAIPECVGVVHNLNPTPGNAILGRVTRTLAGRDRLVEELDGLRFLVSAISFFQVSPAQAQTLYRVAVDQAAPGPRDTVVDLYAGVGTLSLFLARRSGAVEAIEEVGPAVADGRQNAAENHQDNLRFHLGAAEVVLPQLVRAGLRPTVVVLDPPRRGAAPEVLAAILRAAPRRVVYCSCNPATLARDLGGLRGAYRLSAVQPVDMFPQTAHVECSALLELA